MLHLANLTLRLYKDELGFASDNVSPVRFWMRSLPGVGWMVTFAASRAWGSTLRWRSWMSHLLTVDAHLGVAARLRYLDKGAELKKKKKKKKSCLRLDLVLVLAADRRGLLQAVARLVWGLQWWQTLRGPSLLLRSATSWAANGTCWAL